MVCAEKTHAFTLQLTDVDFHIETAQFQRSDRGPGVREILHERGRICSQSTRADSMCIDLTYMRIEGVFKYSKFARRICLPTETAAPFPSISSKRLEIGAYGVTQAVI